MKSNYYVSVYSATGDGVIVSDNMTLDEATRLLSLMTDAEIAYLGDDVNCVSYFLHGDGTVTLDLDDCEEESVALFRQVEEAVNLFRKDGIVQRGATRDEMKFLWEQREEYARLSKLMSENNIQGEEETAYWRLRTIEKLVLYGCNDA